MRHHFSSLARIALVGAMALALGAVAGFAQSNTDTTKESGPAPRASIVADPGVLVVGVQTGSPAEKAGIVRGDVILEAKGAAVNTIAEFAQAVAEMKPGDTLAVKVRHGDAQKSLNVVLAGQAGRTWMGVLLYPVDGREGRIFGGPMGNAFPGWAGAGALVESVTAGSPAEKAGLKKGDMILSVDGTRLDPQHGLGDLIAAKKVGDTVTLSVQSVPEAAEKGSREVKVQLGKTPGKDGPYLGIEYAMAPFKGERMMPGGLRGVFVAEVAGGSPAARAGIAAHDLITKVEGTSVTDPRQVVDAVGKHKPGESLALTVRHGITGREAEVTVTLGENPKEPGKAYMGVSMREMPFGPEDREGGQGMRGIQPGQPPAL
jgi:S1-C subfamily serine protease